jgi:hypothetical protein
LVETLAIVFAAVVGLVVLVLLVLPGVAVVFVAAAGLPGVVEEVLLFGAICSFVLFLFRYYNRLIININKYILFKIINNKI